MKTPAAILVEQRQPLELAEVEVPILGFGQVLVEVVASRICGSQLGEIDGAKGPDKWLPHLLGHEGSGIVREIGPEVTRVKVGDKVCLHWRPGAGIESRPPQYRWASRTVNAGFITTFNHLAVISENRLTAVPGDLDDEVICLLADTITTGFGVISNEAKVRFGEAVVVIGCGGIGLGVIQGAKLAGAHPVIGVDVHKHKLRVAERFGATHTINSKETRFPEQVRAILNRDPEVVIDGTGNPEIVAQAYELTAKKGRTVLFGVMRSENTVRVNTLPLHFGKTLSGSEGGASRPHEDIPRYLRLIHAGMFDPKPMVSHRGRLEDVNRLIAQMRAGEVVHAVMHYSNSTVAA